MKSGVAGVENLNSLLQQALNPFVYGKGELQVGKNVIRVGDRVMQTVNNYELPFVDISPTEAWKRDRAFSTAT